MGRTQATYRMRLQDIETRMRKLLKSSNLSKKYQEIWIPAHQLSAPASTLPYPDTHAIATFCMILDFWAELDNLEELINNTNG